MGSHAHDKGLTSAYLMVANATAILQEHPDTVLLRLVDILDIELWSGKSLQVNAGEGLVSSVILGFDETVELPVIHGLKLVTLLLGEVGEVIREAVADLLNLAVGKLDLLHVRAFDIVTVIIITDALLNVRRSVMEGMLKQCHTVKVLIFTMDAELLTDLGIPTVLGRDGILIDMLRITDRHLGTENLRHVSLVMLGGNPALTELQTNLIKGNLLGNGSLQGSLGLFQGCKLFL